MVELSIVIPTYNRAERLRACIEALARQTQPPKDFEVIVVIDGGTDNTDQMLAALKLPFNLRTIFQENKGQNVARNYGVTFAQGRFCLFLDDDIIAEPQLVAEHLQLHRDHEGKVGIGQMSLKIPKNSNWFITTYAKGWHQHYEELNRGVRQPFWLDCYGGNLSIPRSVFLEVGGFSVDIRRNHDIEFGYRLQQQGVALAYLPRALGKQDERKDVAELLTDLEKSGAAWLILCQRHPGMYPFLIGSLHQGLRESLLLEVFWRFGVSPEILARFGGLISRIVPSQKWFRFLNQYCRWRGFRREISNRNDSQRLIRGTPILMYHAFGKLGEKPSRFVLPIDRFARQMAWLKRLGYSVLSLEEFLQYKYKQTLPPPRSVVITIDDGYEELHTLVYPILKRFSFLATVFLVTSKVGACNDWVSVKELQGRHLLSWTEIREMAKNGIQFGAHSRTHPKLAVLPLEQAREEIVGSKEDLEKSIQMSVHTFAYPFGEFDAAVQSIVEQAGFLGGCSANSGLNVQVTPTFALHRIEVEGTFSLPSFLLALWLGSPS